MIFFSSASETKQNNKDLWQTIWTWNKLSSFLKSVKFFIISKISFYYSRVLVAFQRDWFVEKIPFCIFGMVSADLYRWKCATFKNNKRLRVCRDSPNYNLKTLLWRVNLVFSGKTIMFWGFIAKTEDFYNESKFI